MGDGTHEGASWCCHSRTQVVAHSVGTWNAYEFLTLARARGLPMPRRAFLSAMAPPDLPPQQRPWRQQRALPEADFKASVGLIRATGVDTC